MKSLLDLFESLLHECGRKCGVQTTRDVKTLRRRVEHEGDSFTTITLPSFSADFERSLDLGRVAPGAFRAFGKAGAAGIPQFLGGFLSHVFDKNGVLIADPCINCIRSVRQVCLFGKKVLAPCAQARVERTLRGYVETDSECQIDFVDTDFGTRFKKVAQVLLASLDLESPTIGDIMPQHGPGQTAEKLLNNSKWSFTTWPQRLEDAGLRFVDLVWPHKDMLEHERRYLPTFTSPEEEPAARLVTVPKTVKSPRLIAVEPVAIQFCQQGLKRFLVSRLEAGHLTRNIRFTDQGVNQVLANDGSTSGRLATVDMSEASDRVSLAHVRTLFASSPTFLSLLEATRSTRVDLCAGGEQTQLTLRKFASMGSALCFPVEAMVFYCAIVASRLGIARTTVTDVTVKRFGRDVHVYGDDLIFPAREAPTICEDLEALGLKVNRSKSFWTGKFRESCGKDWYDGQDVTPVYVRRLIPTDRADPSGFVSSVSLGNQLWEAGYPMTAQLVRKRVELHYGRRLPVVQANSSVIGWLWGDSPTITFRVNHRLQRAEFRALVADVSFQEDPLEGSLALAKCFRVINSFIDPEHLNRSVRGYSLTLKRKWVDAGQLASGGCCYSMRTSSPPIGGGPYKPDRKSVV